MADQSNKGDVGGSSRAAWSEQDKISFLLQIYTQSRAAIDWEKLELPEGRTKKACERMLDNLKRLSEKSKTTEGAKPAPSAGKKAPAATASKPKTTRKTKKDEDQAESGAEAPKSPKKAAAKRGRKRAVAKDEEDEEEASTVSSKKPKAEEEGDEDEV
ncbi:hypothetical protein K402DRAFT_394786 [Aulographum hederae CBS 113979]|uniref:Myb-like domain-containing protein n=1 Tax=Aulographum hederae CBS 113979 TaxID=1176131 RepID=A0A6G1GXG7_9PEZI|nr:hypothetical protein K402DRAFT_394786 [Aulographum hederae CBS 113979]